MSESPNKRIVKNTVYLYIRMLIMMLVSLYTSRVIISILGVDDFGIYNIIGGIVVFFSFLNNAMSNATQRFLSYDLGNGNISHVKQTFNMSLTCHIIIAFIACLLLETVGLWFVNYQLKIPESRLYAANWVYQLSILTFVFSIIRVPYNATLISYEKMGFYAYISVLEVILKLLIVYMLNSYYFDKLILYAMLILFVTIACTMIYVFYCMSRFKICKYSFFWDSNLFNKMMNFSGWSMFGGAASLTSQQGGNILINIFGNISANAAYGIANQVSTAVYSLISNFQIAFNPQIIKLYASNESIKLYQLMNRTAKFSYYLLFVLIMPFFLNIEYVLELWLKNVPNFTSSFCIYMILFLLIDALQAPLWMAVYATGNIKTYQTVVSFITFINIPISWILLLFGMPITVIVFNRLALNFICSIFRTIYLNHLINFPSKIYFFFVLKDISIVTIISAILCVLFKLIFASLHMSIILFLLESFCYFSITSFVIYIFGLRRDEKRYISNFIIKCLNH